MCNPDVNGVHAVKVELVLQGLDLGLQGRHLASVLHQLEAVYIKKKKGNKFVCYLLSVFIVLVVAVELHLRLEEEGLEPAATADSSADGQGSGHHAFADFHILISRVFHFAVFHVRINSCFLDVLYTL